MFNGFPSETFDFLTELGNNNDKTWFDAHRDDYQHWYVEPARAFVVAAGERLNQFAPSVQAEPKVNGSIFRINRDTRFSKDKTPYKDHLDLWFWEGARRGAVSGFFVRFTATNVIVGAGCHGFEKQHLRHYREALCSEASGLKLLGVTKALNKQGYEIAGTHYKRPPAEFQPVNPNLGPLLLHNALYTHVEIDGADAERETEEVLNVCVRHWNAFAPLHHWLISNVAERAIGAPGRFSGGRSLRSDI